MLQTLFGPIFVNTLLIAIILIVLKSSWKEVIFFIINYKANYFKYK